MQTSLFKLLLCTEISRQGEKYLDKQIENAVNGVKEMKNVMEKSSDDRRMFLDALEQTKMHKEVTSSRTTVNLGLYLTSEKSETLSVLFPKIDPPTFLTICLLMSAVL